MTLPARSPSPTLSVVLPTRNRADHAVACAQSILRNAGFLELLVVDQSDGPATEQGLLKLEDARLRYVHSDQKGVTNGRNLGIDMSHGDVIVFTDDDCRVAPDWIASLTAIFVDDPAAAVVCGRVYVPPEVRKQGFAESFEPHVREWQGRYPPFGSDWGITANLAVRREVLARVGKFDPMLGAGAPLRSGGEPDLLFRVLKAGLKIVNAQEVSVDHYGVRAPGRETQKLIRGYGAGTGAALYKHVRLGDIDALGVYLRFVGANVHRAGASLVRGKRPVGLGFLVAFLGGTINSYKFRVDTESRQYVER